MAKKKGGSRGSASRPARGPSKGTPARRKGRSDDRRTRARPKKGATPSWGQRLRDGLARVLRWVRDELLLAALGVAVGLALAAALLYADARVAVRAYLADPPRTEPTTVWSAPMRLRAGEPLDPGAFEADLLAATYEAVATLTGPGQFVRRGDTFEVWTAPVQGPVVALSGGRHTIAVADGRVRRVEPGEVAVLRPTKLATLGDLDAARTPVTLDTVSPWMAPALLAIEDARFREHVGIDPIGIARALVNNLRGRDLEGGSTLTQQLAKNLFLGRERTIQRKLREVFHAAALEAELDKDALLELYLSEVYLGHVGGVPIHGVEEAARAWFGKSARRLDAAEAATVAGVIASPNVYSPLRSHEHALARRQQVLRRMVHVRAITEEQAAQALDAPLATVAVPPTRAWRLPWVVDAALDAAEDAVGDVFDEAHGLHVYTTVQPHLQRAAAATVDRTLGALAEAHPEAADVQGALVHVEVATGDVVAIVGGRDHGESPFHRATRAWRQAGSTVKPLTLLGALDHDPRLTLATLVEDAPLTRRWEGQVWSPTNYDGRNLDPLPVRRALEQSRNLPAVRIAERLGAGRQRDLFVRAGLTKATDLPSAALGAFPVTPLQLAGAYTAFAGEGEARAPRLLLGILGGDGTPRLVTRPDRTPLARPDSAVLVADALRGVLLRGTGRRVARLGLPVDERTPLAGKTGTTDNGRDAWFAGFDGERAVVVWVGRDRADLGLTGGEAALPTWAAYVQATGGPRGHLPDHPAVVRAGVCASTGRPPCRACDDLVQERFRRGTVPDCADPPRRGRADRPGRGAEDDAEETPTLPAEARPG